MPLWRVHKDNCTFNVKSARSLCFEVPAVFISSETFRSGSSMNLENMYNANWTKYE